MEEGATEIKASIIPKMENSIDINMDNNIGKPIIISLKILESDLNLRYIELKLKIYFFTKTILDAFNGLLLESVSNDIFSFSL